MGQWSQRNRRGGAQGEIKTPTVSVATISAAGSGEVDINTTLLGPVQRSTIRIWDTAAPTVILQVVNNTTALNPGLAYVSGIVGHVYQGDVQAFYGPYASPIKLTGTVTCT